jgi:hypothetical protein
MKATTSEIIIILKITMKKIILTLVIGFAGLSVFAQAPLPEEPVVNPNAWSHAVNISISDAASVSELNEDALDFTYGDADAIDADAAETQTKSLDIKANYAWKLTAYALGDFSDGAETDPATIPLTVLKLNNTAILAEEANAVTIKSGDAGVSANTKINYKVKLGNNKWTYKPTDYTTTVFLTFSAQ